MAFDTFVKQSSKKRTWIILLTDSYWYVLYFLLLNVPKIDIHVHLGGPELEKSVVPADHCL